MSLQSRSRRAAPGLFQETNLNLLLLLTALFASMTGASSGERADAVRHVAVVQAARAAQAAAQPAQRVLPAAAAQPVLRPERVRQPLPAVRPLVSLPPVSERRLE